MPDLLPTPARLSVLRAVADGQVAFTPGQGTVTDLTHLPGRDVLREAGELRRAGWITIDVSNGRDTLGSFYYEITDQGRAVLAGQEATR